MSFVALQCCNEPTPHLAKVRKIPVLCKGHLKTECLIESPVNVFTVTHFGFPFVTSIIVTV
jgi:hypothetical protein